MNEHEKHYYYMQLAKRISNNSTCLKHPVGVVLVQNDQVVATSYNHVPNGLKPCAEVGCPRIILNAKNGEKAELCRGLHAEQALIVSCLKKGISLEGGVVYCNRSPCSICAKMLSDLNIHAFYYTDLRVERTFQEIFNASGISYYQLEEVCE